MEILAISILLAIPVGVWLLMWYVDGFWTATAIILYSFLITYAIWWAGTTLGL